MGNDPAREQASCGQPLALGKVALNQPDDTQAAEGAGISTPRVTILSSTSIR